MRKKDLVPSLFDVKVTDTGREGCSVKESTRAPTWPSHKCGFPAVAHVSQKSLSDVL